MGRLTPEQCERIERIEAALGGSNQSPELRERMIERLEWIFRLSPGQVFGPYLPGESIPDYRRLHANLRKAGEKVRAVLHDDDWRADEVDEIMGRIDDITPEVDKGGRPANWRLYGVICELGKLYSQCTSKTPSVWHDAQNKSAPYGPFFSLVRECLHVFAPDLYYSDAALDSSIDKALKRCVRPTV